MLLFLFILIPNNLFNVFLSQANRDKKNPLLFWLYLRHFSALCF